MPKQKFKEVREDVLERDNHVCRFCGVSDDQHREEHGNGLDVHHIIPRRVGGSNVLRNLISVCRSCHQTLESTQGDAIAQMKDAGIVADKSIEEENERLRKENNRLEKSLESAVKSIHMLERYLRQPDYLADRADLAYARYEIVTKNVGQKTTVRKDSQKAYEDYEEWGTRIERGKIPIDKETVENLLDSFQDWREIYE